MQAALLDEATRSIEPQYVEFLLERIIPFVSNLPRIRDSKARMREAAIANVCTQVHNLKQNPVVLEAVQNKELAVINAYYEIRSGAVDVLEEEELCLDDEEFPRNYLQL